MKTSPIAVILIAGAALAQSATWNLNPVSSDWNTAANWTPKLVPNGPNATALFAQSNITAVSLSKYIDIPAISFSAGASPYVITVPAGVSLMNSGITNNSGIVQRIVAEGGAEIHLDGRLGGDDDQLIEFDLLASDTPSQPGSYITFSDTLAGFGGSSTVVDLAGSSLPNTDAAHAYFSSVAAANGAINVHAGASKDGSPASVTFSDNASAGYSHITCDGAAFAGSSGGSVDFVDNAMASSGSTEMITVNGGLVPGAAGGVVRFQDDSEFLDTIAIANGGAGDGGAIYISDDSVSSESQISVFDNGYLDISEHSSGGVSIGSLSGNGLVFLGANNLSVGAVFNYTSTFSGTLQDGGGGGGTGGSLTKVGTGRLTLTGNNTYTGATNVDAGALVVKNRSGFATGTGPVNINLGTLSGTGTIADNVTIGTGSGTGAYLAPSTGASHPAILTVNGTFTFKADGAYNYKLNTNKVKADQLIANGVTIENGAQFSFKTVANKKLTAGTIFTAINNTATTPIFGTFANLADGSTVTVGVNKLQVSYSGGDGNDLTLTVVP